MKFSKLFLVALGSVSLLVSCSKEDISAGPEGAYSKGVFVLNEGGSGQGVNTPSFAPPAATQGWSIKPLGQ